MINLFEILNSKHFAMIGTDSDNDLVLNDSEVSPQHCQITKIDEGKYLIVDLDSASGTYLNNRKIEKEFITDTDFISVGSTIFQIRKKIKEQELTNTSSNEHLKEATSSGPSDTPEMNFVSGDDSTNATQTISTGKSSIIVYFLAAPEDEVICRAIDRHLSSIRFGSKVPIEIYGDFKIPAGEDTAKYKLKLFEAHIVLAFISVDFINNNECYERNQKVIAKYNRHETILMPILVRNCMWKATPFANLPLYPKNLQPLNNKQFWNSEDDAITTVVTDIYNSINDFTDENTDEQPLRNTARPTVELKVDWRKEYNRNVFWKRVAAYLSDAIIITFPLAILVYSFGVGVFDLYPEYNNYDSGIMLFFVFVGQLFVNSTIESSQLRATPGKRLLKLQITDTEGHPLTFGKAFERNIIKYILIVFTNVWAGFALIYFLAQVLFFVKNKKFIHDSLSSTVIGERLN